MKIKFADRQAEVLDWVKLSSTDAAEIGLMGRISALAQRPLVKHGSEFHVELPFLELVRLAAK